MSPVAGNYLERVYGPFFWLLVLIQFAYFFTALMNMFHALKSVGSVNQKKQLATAVIGMFVLTDSDFWTYCSMCYCTLGLPTVPGL